MSKFKQKLIKGLSAFLLAGAFLFPKAQAQERIIIDNFSQPNDTTLNYYGSGDVFLDNKIDSLDTYRLDSLINDTFTGPLDDRLLDRGKPKPLAQIAIMRKLVLLAHSLYKNKQKYDPNRYLNFVQIKKVENMK